MELHLPQLDGDQGLKGIICRRIVQDPDLIAQRNCCFHLIQYSRDALQELLSWNVMTTFLNPLCNACRVEFSLL